MQYMRQLILKDLHKRYGIANNFKFTARQDRGSRMDRFSDLVLLFNELQRPFNLVDIRERFSKINADLLLTSIHSSWIAKNMLKVIGKEYATYERDDGISVTKRINTYIIPEHVMREYKKDTPRYKVSETQKDMIKRIISEGSVAYHDFHTKYKDDALQKLIDMGIIYEIFGNFYLAGTPDTFKLITY